MKNISQNWSTFVDQKSRFYFPSCKNDPENGSKTMDRPNGRGVYRFLDFMVRVTIFVPKAAQLMGFTLEKPLGA